MTTDAEEPDLWTRVDAPRRQPRFDREEIAGVALRLADAEGFDALSMRRLANELGAGTMTLYHYVRSKDELVALLANAVVGEALVPDDALPDDWHEALMLLARRLRDALRRHGWLLDHTGAGDPSFGPNGGRFVEQALRALRPLDLPVGDRLAVVETIWEYVLGFSHSERHPLPLLGAGMQRYVSARGDDGRFRELAAVFARHDAAGLIAGRPDPDERFERNLRRLLAGVDGAA